MNEVRKETYSLGPLEVPADGLCGGQTQSSANISASLWMMGSGAPVPMITKGGLETIPGICDGVCERRHARERSRAGCRLHAASSGHSEGGDGGQRQAEIWCRHCYVQTSV